MLLLFLHMRTDNRLDSRQILHINFYWGHSVTFETTSVLVDGFLILGVANFCQSQWLSQWHLTVHIAIPCVGMTIRIQKSSNKIMLVVISINGWNETSNKAVTKANKSQTLLRYSITYRYDLISLSSSDENQTNSCICR